MSVYSDAAVVVLECGCVQTLSGELLEPCRYPENCNRRVLHARVEQVLLAHRVSLCTCPVSTVAQEVLESISEWLVPR